MAQHMTANGLTRQNRREKAYGIGLQPRALRVAPPQRTINPEISYSKDELLEIMEVRKELRAEGRNINQIAHTLNELLQQKKCMKLSKKLLI